MEFRKLAEYLLKISENCLPVETVHGMLTAITIGPLPVDPDIWLPLIFGETQTIPPMEDGLEKEIRKALSTMAREILPEIENGTWTPLILGLETDGKVEFDAQPWCAGFLLGVNLNRKSWLTEEHKNLFDSMMPIFFLAYPENYGSVLANHGPEEVRGMQSDFMDELSDLIPGIYRYWQKRKKASYTV